MQILSSATAPTTKGPDAMFAGDVYIDFLGTLDPSRVTGGNVHFTPGSHTHWHTHRLGQMIFVTEGTGLCQREGGPVQTIKAGDVVYFEPGEKHWHGATPDRLMVHVAIQPPDTDPNATIISDPVAYEQYNATPAS